MILCTGCKKYIMGPEEIEEITLLKVAGIDKTPNKVRLTSVIQNVNAKCGQKQELPLLEPKVLFSEGKTVFDAVRIMNIYSDKRLFLGRLRQILIGENTAKTGVRNILDFFARNNETRLDINIFVTDNYTAEELIKVSTVAAEKTFIGSKLDTLVKNHWATSMSTIIKLNEFIAMLDSKTTAPYLPSINTQSEVERVTDKFIDKIQLSGIFVFKDDKLLYRLDGIEARAFNFIKGEARSGIIIVKDHTGQYVSLEIVEAESKIKTYIENEIPRVVVNIEMSSNIVEQWSTENIYTEQELNYLKAQQEETIRKEAVNVIKKAQSMNTDIFGFGEKICHQHPRKWRKIENKWDTIFPDLDVKVNVKSKINRTYTIEKPTQYEKKGKKE